MSSRDSATIILYMYAWSIYGLVREAPVFSGLLTVVDLLSLSFHVIGCCIVSG